MPARFGRATSIAAWHELQEFYVFELCQGPITLPLSAEENRTQPEFASPFKKRAPMPNGSDSNNTIIPLIDMSSSPKEGSA